MRERLEMDSRDGTIPLSSFLGKIAERLIDLVAIDVCVCKQVRFHTISAVFHEILALEYVRRERYWMF